MKDLSDQELAKEFLSKVSDKNNRIISLRFRPSFLENNLSNYLKEINSRTSFLDESFNLRERAFFLENNIKELTHCIVCGNPVHPKATDGWDKAKINDVCSNDCWHKHPNKSAMVKEWAKKSDRESAKIKREQTMIEKFGVGYTLQRADVQQKNQEAIRNKNIIAYEKLRDKDWIQEEYVNKKRFLTDIADELNCYYGTVSDWVVRHGFEVRQTIGYSQLEIDCRNFVESLGVEVIQNCRGVLPENKEIDIYVPSKKLGIEIDGIFWHSFNSQETTEQKNYHLQKTKDAATMGIDLLHFWDSEWLDKQSIVKSMIRAKLGLIQNKIYARKCLVVELTSRDARKFFDENHLSGFVAAKVYVGLVCDGILVHACSFGIPRDKRNKEQFTWELIRSASLIDHVVIGGLCKCLKWFCENYCNFGDKILSYAERRYSNGSSYLKNGFALVDCNETVGYWWVLNKKVEHRSKFNKAKLSGVLENFDPNKSESENMFANKYRRLWDCGNHKFVFIV